MYKGDTDVDIVKPSHDSNTLEDGHAAKVYTRPFITRLGY
jgi:hypothetical protein